MVKKIRGSSRSKLKLPSSHVIIVRAALWRRILAFLVDFMIMQLVIIRAFDSIFAKVSAAGATFSEISVYLEANPAIYSQINWAIICIGILTIAYFVIMQYRFRQTLGMMMFNIKIESLNKEIGIMQLIVSNLMLLPVFPFLLLWIIDPIYSIFNKNSQRLTQKVVGLYVSEELQTGFNYEK